MSRNVVAKFRCVAEARRSTIVLLIGVTLVGCSLDQYLFFFELASLAEAVERYFTSGDFVRDVDYAVDFAQKALGSGGW